jgi:hypothetical protein
VAAVGYMARGNPEVAFANRVVGQQQERLRETEDERQILLVGGSSCSFSIDPQVLEAGFGLKAVNLGLPAGTGRGLHFEKALQAAGKGDVVVLAFEMTGWTDEEGDLVTPLGAQLWHLCLKTPWGGHSQLPRLGIDEHYALTDVRPGGRHCVTRLTKMLLGRPPFRYGDETLQGGGYLATSEAWKLSPEAVVRDYRLGPGMEELLARFTVLMKERGVEVVATLPWQFTAAEVAGDQREANRALLADLARHCAVIRDPRLGVESDGSLFADTNWHLTREGARVRTRELGESLQGWLEQGEKS